jgi:hypothetical protein
MTPLPSAGETQTRGARLFRLAAAVAGLLVGLRLALPGSVSAAVLLEIAGAVLAFRLLADAVLGSAPSLLRRRSRGKHARASARATAPPAPADDLLAAASWGAVTAAPAQPVSPSVHSVRAAAHAAAGVGPEQAPASEPELPEPASAESDQLLAAASWGAPAPRANSTRRSRRRAKAVGHTRDHTPRGEIVDPLLMAASWGSAAPASKRTRRKSQPPDPKPADLSLGAHPFPIAAYSDTRSTAGPRSTGDASAHDGRGSVVAAIRRIIDPRVLPRLHLPSLRLPLPSRLLPSRLRLPAVSRTRGQRIVHVAFLLTGVAIGLRWALPIADVSSHCPPQGEGQVMCTIQKAWLAALVQFAAPVVAAHVLAKLTLHTIPATIRRWRAGWRPARRAAAPPSKRFAEDPALRAAAWGHTGEDEAPEQTRTPDRELVERVRAPRVVPVRSAPPASKGS